MALNIRLIFYLELKQVVAVPCRFREGIMKPIWIAIFFTSAIEVRLA